MTDISPDDHPLIPADITGFSNPGGLALGWHPTGTDYLHGIIAPVIPVTIAGQWFREAWGSPDGTTATFVPRDEWVLLAQEYQSPDYEKPLGSSVLWRWYPDAGATEDQLADYSAWYEPYGATSPTLGLAGGFSQLSHLQDDGGIGGGGGNAGPRLGIQKPLPEGSFTGIRRRNISIAFPHSPDLFSPESGIAGAPTNLLERPTDIDLVEPDPREITTSSGSTRGTPRVGL